MSPALRHGGQSSGKTDWETPDDLMAVLRAEFGEFDLDPCATRETAKADRFFRVFGLEGKWVFPKIYCNPPYGRGIGKWVEKCYTEARECNASIVVALLPVATDTYWWQEWVAQATEVRFLKGRLRFKGAAGPAPFASAIVIWRCGMVGGHRVSYWDWKAKL